jgi:hypothetical protein
MYEFPIPKPPLPQYNCSLADFAKYSIQTTALHAAPVLSYPYYLMTRDAWKPIAGTALLLVPFLLLVLVVVLAIKCSDWAPAWWHKIQGIWKLGWPRGPDKTRPGPLPATCEV